ncbi:MAG: hypothetical protein P8Y12_11705 [Gammaproteobacteria bacterium]
MVAGFFSTGGLGALLEEALARVSHTYFSPNKECNVYLGEGAPDLPSDHPRNVFLERNNGFITADRYDQDSVSRRVYQWQPLKRFIADCLGKDELYIYEDPVSNMIVNVGRPGQQFNWHFDTNEFTITMLLQAADSGGYIEYVPNIRQPGDECYPEVQQSNRAWWVTSIACRTFTASSPRNILKIEVKRSGMIDCSTKALWFVNCMNTRDLR